MTSTTRRILSYAALILAFYGSYPAGAVAPLDACFGYLSDISAIVKIENEIPLLAHQQQQQQQRQQQGSASSFRELLDGLVEEELISEIESEQILKNVNSPKLGKYFVSDIEVRQELNALKLSDSQKNLLLVVRALSMYYAKSEFSPELNSIILEILQFKSEFTEEQAKALIGQLPKKKV